MSDARVIRPEALAAWNHLGGVLADLHDEGRTIPCWVDPEPYTSEDPAERAEAAEGCRWCPALAACDRFADAQQERANVWAGRDRSPRPIKRNRKDSTA